jgi:large subunit ribosomal protein L17
MRHANKTKYLGRKAQHRRAMLANMASSLIEHKRINTTVAKAKALKRYVEPLITKSKEDNTHNRRVVFSYLRDKNATAELFREVVAKVGDRPGGYTRIIRTGNRLGDNAEMCLIELVDFNELYTGSKKEKSKSRRRRRGGSKKATDTAAQAQTADAPQEEEAAPIETNAPKDEEKKAARSPEGASLKEEAPKSAPKEDGDEAQQ